MIPPKILIVEDEKSLRQVLKEKLEKEGFDILEAPDGKEGLKLALEKNPDLILLDIMMPIMDGFEMAQKLRQEEKKRSIVVKNQIPIIFLTNLSGEENMAQAQKIGIYKYLVKSNLQIEGVVRQIKEELDKS